MSDNNKPRYIKEIERGATELNLQRDNNQSHLKHFLLTFFTGNNIGVERAKALAETLKTNTSLT